MGAVFPLILSVNMGDRVIADSPDSNEGVLNSRDGVEEAFDTISDRARTHIRRLIAERHPRIFGEESGELVEIHRVDGLEYMLWLRVIRLSHATKLAVVKRLAARSSPPTTGDVRTGF